ncbi:uncharacterized protein AKAME5_002609400 [Lates japonicus]|uniref:Ig-like domain-containing protein n=1 Tax=Lates japonicus TaxID=270547 RepID=A0AAD3RNB9_LATJO|nr:uncharacterized protein AKAME5_002609400 [Lates japonicus]
MFRKLDLAVTAVLFISTLTQLTEQTKVTTVKAAVGEDVILPCRLEPPFNFTTVEWKFNGSVVHRYRSGGDDLTDQHLNFKDRTQVKHDNVTLTVVKGEERVDPNTENKTCKTGENAVGELGRLVRAGRFVIDNDEALLRTRRDDGYGRRADVSDELSIALMASEQRTRELVVLTASVVGLE